MGLKEIFHKMMKIGLIIQSRMSSKRFPGKVLHCVSGKPILTYLVESLLQSSIGENIVIATSNEKLDDPIEAFCKNIGIKCYRGLLNDVALRFVKAIEYYRFDAFVRVCGDSPLLDYRLIDKAVDIYKYGKYNLVTNVLKRTFPKGQSVELVDSSIFHSVYSKLKGDEKEHITKHFYLFPDNFKIYNFKCPINYGDIQLSIDNNDDMLQFEKIISLLEKPHWKYNYEEIVHLKENKSIG